MSGETTILQLNKRLTAEQVQGLYDAEWHKAALIYPRLIFEQLDEFQVEMGFHAKSRSFKGIEQYKNIVRMAIQKVHPDCQVN